MADEKAEGRKGYTFVDKRGKDAPEAPGVKGPDSGAGEVRSERQDDPRRRQPEGQPGQRRPSVDFTTLVMSLASAAMMSMGRVADPATGAVRKDLAVAQQNIDIIALLKEKTRGNLTAEEERIVDQVLYELRLTFVEAMRER
ncbi:MAG TPA: DUF1844 domain-containing protein [Deltaproteobacteria bacterium]|nr:DUF1844 domain-containing protein [Deltaproteobacteria bacterium]HOM29627.1 DUF1844 domain-containing protein [Deltaproteobacteria bacterium]HPP79356.1 DUF1844 domain-containing protein [Deltaproteobacteria bacterium]